MDRTSWTANQVVAHNLWRARRLRGLTQDAAAVALEPFLGVRWNKQQFSAAERSVVGKRVREFSADELLAFSRAFRLPVAYFLLPPPDAGMEGTPNAFTSGGPETTSVAGLIDAAVPPRDQEAELRERLSDSLATLDASERTQVQDAIFRYAADQIATIIDSMLDDLTKSAEGLRATADLLEAARDRARAVMDDAIASDPQAMTVAASDDDARA